MLKGAADFLIKPVRRNELRNLWQHAWRRHSLHGRHVPQNLPVVHCKENNTVTNHSSDYAASMQKSKGSEKESDAQSSCTLPYLEAESAYVQKMQGLSQLKCSRASNSLNADVEKHEECVKLETESLMPESKPGRASDELIVSEKLNRSGSKVAHCTDALTLEKDCACVKAMPQDEGMGPENDRRNAYFTSPIRDCNDELIEPSSRAIDLIGTFDNHLKSTERLSTLSDGTNKFEFSPELELSLRKYLPTISNDQDKDERHTLNHSTASAFSWYNNSKTFPTLASNFNELKDGASKSGEILSNQLSENATLSSQPCGVTSSNGRENMTSLVTSQSGQAEETYPRPHLGFYPVPGVRFDNISAGYSHLFGPIFYTQSCFPPACSPMSPCQQEHSPFPMCTSPHSNPDIQDSEQGYRRSGEIANNSIDQPVREQNELEPLEELRHSSPAAGQNPNRTLCPGPANNNSSGIHGGVCSRIFGKSIDKETAPQNLNEGTLFIHDGLRRIGSRRSSQREASLTKFRMKRKDRCYEKKVRHQSRKYLAEQRPRVKGQFVRQSEK